jgi:hypothetical protein
MGEGVCLACAGCGGKIGTPPELHVPTRTDPYKFFKDEKTFKPKPQPLDYNFPLRLAIALLRLNSLSALSQASR